MYLLKSSVEYEEKLIHHTRLFIMDHVHQYVQSPLIQPSVLLWPMNGVLVIFWKGSHKRQFIQKQK